MCDTNRTGWLKQLSAEGSDTFELPTRTQPGALFRDLVFCFTAATAPSIPWSSRQLKYSRSKKTRERDWTTGALNNDGIRFCNVLHNIQLIMEPHYGFPSSFHYVLLYLLMLFACKSFNLILSSLCLCTRLTQYYQHKHPREKG